MLDLTAISRFHAAVGRTHALIDPDFHADKSLQALRARAERRLERLRLFLAYIGDPHLAYPVIHVGGTSGKGSTATAIAAIASAAGLSVGLHTSPYLQSATEKLQIGGRLIAPADFADLVDELIDATTRWEAGPLTYGELWFSIAALAFARAAVDLAVIEVGAGGRFDLTNVVSPAVSVITSVGLDHTETLGPTIPDIAWHKAGIIKPGAPAVTAVSDPAALEPIEIEAQLWGVPLIRVAVDDHATTSRELTRWLDDGQQRVTAMAGRFQATNASLAIAALRQLPGLTLTDAAISNGLAQTRIPGRAEVVQRDPVVLLDGAHNPQKMEALVADLDTLAARSDGGRLIVLLGLLASKDRDDILRTLLPHADALLLTTPQVLAKPAAAPADLAAEARALGFAGPITIEPDPAIAIERALADATPTDVIVVTGSLYLLGNIRGRWYPDDSVILQQTSWPAR